MTTDLTHFFDSPLVTAIIVAALLLVLLAALRGPIRLLTKEFATLWNSLRPEFKGFAFERWTTQTLHLLVSAMLAFAILSVGWAACAGLLRAVSLLAGDQPGAPGLTSKIQSSTALLCGTGCTWSTWTFVAAEMLRAASGVLLTGTAAGLVGSLVGFVFGIPRPVSDPVPAGAVDAVAPAARRTASNTQKRAWKLSTNLTDVSDWLTKIIVGVGLVEAKNGVDGFQQLAGGIALLLFNSRHGSPVLIAAVMLGSMVFGFLFAYLFAQLIVSRLMEFADTQIYAPDRGANEALISMQSFQEALVPRISRSARWPEPVPSPTVAQLTAALRYQPITFDELLARPDVSASEVRSWARARAILNDYPQAARAYVHLLGMNVE